ncbi:MAG: tetratricopeptide repeat protein [Clostridiaceae bacterium]|jgi:tetratricopeptide (TPR) repeat protein|nr:tetratricopeptide repeat protein [Clostridiaceae bacterium]
MKRIILYVKFCIAWFIDFMKDGKSLKHSLNLALVYERMGRVFHAARIYYRNIKMYPDDPRAYYGIAILYDNKKRYREAVDWFKKAIDINPDFVPAWFFMAGSLYELGEKHAALDCYKKVISLNPSNFWAHNNAGSICEELNMNTEALQYFRKALEIIPGHHKVLFNMGVVFAKMGYELKAQECYWESIRGYNRYPYSFLNLSLLYKEEKELDRAIIVISEGIRCNPGAPFLYYNRACFLAMAGNIEEAFLDVVRAAKLNPEFLNYAENDEDLEDVRKHPGYQALKKYLQNRENTNA